MLYKLTSGRPGLQRRNQLPAGAAPVDLGIINRQMDKQDGVPAPVFSGCPALLTKRYRAAGEKACKMLRNSQNHTRRSRRTMHGKISGTH